MRLIIFDFDGTLCDTRDYIVHTMQQAIRELGLPPRSDEACAATIGLPLKGCFLQLFPDLEDPDFAMATYRRIFNENRATVRILPFPGVLEVIGRLKDAGYLLAVASSRSSRSLLEFLEENGLAELFSCVLGADNVTLAKPHPEPVLKVLEALNVPAEETLVVGDMPVDILMGSRAGARTCGVTYGNSTRSELQEAGADYVIDSFSDLEKIL